MRTSRRDDVRTTAARLFRAHGYSSATMDMLAADVGLNKGTLYHYYPSKSAILCDLLTRQMAATLSLWEHVPTTGTPTERLREIVRLEVQVAARSADEVVVFFQEFPWIDKHLTPEQSVEVKASIDRHRTLVQELLEEGVATGEFRAADVPAVYHSITGILAYIPSWFRARSGRTEAVLVDELADFVISGISTTAAVPASAGRRGSAPSRGSRVPSASSG